MYKDLLNCKTIVIITTLIAMVTFITNFKWSRYQVASCGMNKAIVVDQCSGEAWVTENYESLNSEKLVCLVPVGYCGYQNDTYTYTPDEKRSNKNTTWLIRLKRIFVGL